jgi:hypothetical protein
MISKSDRLRIEKYLQPVICELCGLCELNEADSDFQSPKCPVRIRNTDAAIKMMVGDRRIG